MSWTVFVKKFFECLIAALVVLVIIAIYDITSIQGLQLNYKNFVSFFSSPFVKILYPLFVILMSTWLGIMHATPQGPDRDKVVRFGRIAMYAAILILLPVAAYFLVGY
jgi:succinate dehydrogenase hydrophobic anchor subunit